MTDLRAALGLEPSDGPLLSALKTGDYSDVIVLAYTDAAKGAPSDLTQPDAVANTDEAHLLFEAWLCEQLEACGLESVNVTVLPTELSHLNDGEGIYQAASMAVTKALSDPSPKTITTYVSPGTPVMAYTWALIAKSNPQVNLNVIASSNPATPPEKIHLPVQLLNANLPAATSSEPTAHKYDVTIHLLGDQTLPIYFGMQQFPAANTLFVTTKEYKAKANHLAKLAGLTTKPIIIENAFDQAETKAAILNAVDQYPAESKIAVNLTGGTKIMFAGGLAASWERGLDPFYFEVKGHNVIFLRDGSQVPFVGISNVEDFIKAANFELKSDGTLSSARAEFEATTCDMWEYRAEIGKLYQSQKFREFGRMGRAAENAPFEFKWGNNFAAYDGYGKSELVLNGVELEAPGYGFYRFLSGGWLEEYVYSLLVPLEEEGLIKDIRIGLEVGYPPNTNPNQPNNVNPIQEFDCAFTDGKRLWVIECKAGAVKQEDIQKFENNLKHYGGVAAKGILATSFRLTPENHQRVKGFPAIIPINQLTTEAIQEKILAA